MTITLTREEVQQLLDAWDGYDQQYLLDRAIENLRARLAQPEPEPVAWMNTTENGVYFNMVKQDGWKPLYTTSLQREWHGLTDEERLEAEVGCMFMDEFDTILYADNIEAKLKEKNHG